MLKTFIEWLKERTVLLEAITFVPVGPDEVKKRLVDLGWTDRDKDGKELIDGQGHPYVNAPMTATYVNPETRTVKRPQGIPQRGSLGLNAHNWNDRGSLGFLNAKRNLRTMFGEPGIANFLFAPNYNGPPPNFDRITQRLTKSVPKKITVKEFIVELKRKGINLYTTEGAEKLIGKEINGKKVSMGDISWEKGVQHLELLYDNGTEEKLDIEKKSLIVDISQFWEFDFDYGDE